MTPNTKKCTKCKKHLPLSAFWKEAHGKYGVKSQCKECHYKYRKKIRQKKPAAQKTYTPKSYKGPAFVEIRFCKECGKLLDQPWPLKGVIRKEYYKRDRDYWRAQLCHACMSQKISDEIDRHYRLKRLRKERRFKKRFIGYCIICGQAFNRWGYRPHYSDYTGYLNTCSLECESKRNNARNIYKTGIPGIGKASLKLLAPENPMDWAERHQEYHVAVLAKEYMTIKRLRIDTKKEVRNGTS